MRDVLERVLILYFTISFRGRHTKMSTEHTFASLISRSITSLAHFKFCAGSGKSSHETLIYPCSFPVSFGPTPASFGGSGVHRTPARILILCIASSPRKGSSATGTTTVLLIVAGWSSPA
jgi:hypothetical protein